MRDLMDTAVITAKFKMREFLCKEDGEVNIISMVAKGSVDEGVEEYLLENKELFDRVVDGKGSKTDIQTILYKKQNKREKLLFFYDTITIRKM